MNLIHELEKELGKPLLPPVHVGDTVEVHYLIREGEKERIQLFVGTVLRIQGRGIRRSITVRRIVAGEGVERLFPMHNPRVKDVVVTRRGEVRRARLYYPRGGRALDRPLRAETAGPNPPAPAEEEAVNV